MTCLPHSARPLAAGALLAAAACAPFRFASQQVWLRHDAPSDVTELVVVYHGLHPSGKTDRALEQCAASVSAIAAGARAGMLFDWPFVFDLDADDLELEELFPGDPTEARELAHFLAQITVERHGLFFDEAGGVGSFQHFRIPAASAGLHLVNRAIRSALLRANEAGKTPLEVGRRALFERWLERARDGEPFFEWRAGGLRVTLPSSPESTARAASELLHEALDEPETAELCRALARAWSAVQVDRKCVVLDFLPLPRSSDEERLDDGWVRIELERSGWQDDGRLGTQLVADGIELSTRTRAEILGELFRGR